MVYFSALTIYMKKSILRFTAAIIVLFAATAGTLQQSTGMAGHTGSPGEPTCTACHGGGSAASQTLNITATPSFSNNEYMPDSTYVIHVEASATGFSNYGFNAEVLAPDGASTGTMSSNLAAGVQTLTGPFQRQNATHTTPKSGSMVTFSFPWKAPSTGSVIIYAIANAVNLNQNTTGDFVLTPRTLSLAPAAPTITNGIASHAEGSLSLKIFPNPARDIVSAEFSLSGMHEILLTMVDLKGSLVYSKELGLLGSGVHHAKVSLTDLPAGLYQVEIRSGSQVLSSGRLTTY